MGKLRGLKYFLAIVGLTGLFIMGYTATSVVTSCPAQAQVCCQMPCMGLLTGIVPPMGAITAGNTIIGIGYIMVSIAVYYAAVLAEFMIKVFEQIGTVITHWLNWWDTMWYYNMGPALQDMTRQLVAMDADQARAYGAFADMLTRGRTLGTRGDQEARSHAAQRPGENVCAAGTLSSGMIEADAFTKAYNTAAATEQLGRTGNNVGSPSSAGAAVEMNDRFNTYLARYCDPNENAGENLCTTPGSAKALGLDDRDVTGLIFQQETIDLKNPDIKQAVEDLVTNIAEPFVRDPIPATSFSDPSGQEAILENESYKAKRQTIYDILYHVVARRAPTSSLSSFVIPVHNAAGVAVKMRTYPGQKPYEYADGRTLVGPDGKAVVGPDGNSLFGIAEAQAQPAGTPVSPSKNEVTNVLAVEKSMTGDMGARQVDEPRNNEREAVVQAGIRTRQLSDMLDLLDRTALILAGEIGNQVKADRPVDAKMSSLPKY